MEIIKQWPKPKKVKNKPNRKWVVTYQLSYDGGGTNFTQYYRTRMGAEISSFFHRNLRSWGGSAKLYRK